MSQYLETAGRFRCLTAQPNAGWFGEAGEKQTPFIEILCEVIQDGPYKGKFAHWRGYLSENAFDRTIATLTKACGFSGDLAALESGNESLANKEVDVVTDFEAFEGKERLKVKWLNAPGSGGREPVAKEKVASFVSKFGGRAKAIAKDTQAKLGAETAKGGAAAPKPAPPLAAAKKPEVDEDVPF